MTRTYYLLIPALLTVPALAQKAELKVKPQKDAVLKFEIQSDVQMTQSRKMLINGEEGGFGGGRGGRGGGGGETSASQKVVFDQGPGGWREYHTLEATTTRMGRDGEPQETKIDGALVGKKVQLRTDDAGQVALVEGDGENAQALPANIARNVPGVLSLAGFLPGKEVAVDEEFDISGSFQKTLRGLMHPVTPEPAARGQGGRGQGGRGGQQGGRGQGGRGQGGRAQGMRGARGGDNTVLQLMNATKLECKAIGKLVAIEKTAAGAEMAKVAIEATLSGKGTPQELGLGGGARAFGGRGGQGGRGGRGAGGAGGGEAKAIADVKLAGTLWFDLSSHQVTSLDLKADMATESDTTRVMNRGGEEMEIQSTSSNKGSFQLKVACKPAK